MKILLAGRSQAALEATRAHLAEAGRYEIDSALMVNGEADPLAGGKAVDVVILHASDRVVEDLRLLAERPVRERPALIVVGDRLPHEATKHAMRAGARDFVGESDSLELAEAVRRLELELGDGRARGQTIVVVNAKGGSGGSFVATNLALACAERSSGRTVVVDLDFQYATLPKYLDVTVKRDLLEALAQATELDETASDAYAVRHDSGVHVMASTPQMIRSVEFDVAVHMGALMDVLARRYQRVVVDLPRHLDEAGCRVVTAADEVLLVVQQSLLSLHDAVRLKTLLTRELRVPESRLVTVVNRYTRHGSLGLDDVRNALDDPDPVVIPNHYKLVSQSLDLGVPVLERAPGSAVAKALLALHDRVVAGGVTRPNAGLLARTVFRLRG